MIGDSLTRYLPDNIHSDVVTKPGCTVPRAIKYLRSLEHGAHVPNHEQPHVVMLHVGTNDLCRSVLHSYINYCEHMIHLAREKFLVAKLVISAILPRHDDTDLNGLGQVFNIHVSILCKKLNVRFVNFCEHCESNSLFAFDGLHLNYEGSAKFAQTITDEATSLLVRTIPGSAPHVAKPKCPKELTILVWYLSGIYIVYVLNEKADSAETLKKMLG